MRRRAVARAFAGCPRDGFDGARRVALSIALRARARTRRRDGARRRRAMGTAWRQEQNGDVRGVLGERARGGVSQRRRVPRGRRPGRRVLPGVGVRDVRRGDERGDVEGGASVTLKFFTVASANRARRGRCSRWRRRRRAWRARRDGSTRGRGRRRANRVRWGRLARRLGTRSGARRAERGRRGRARWRIITKRRRARGERRRRGMDRRSIRR